MGMRESVRSAAIGRGGRSISWCGASRLSALVAGSSLLILASTAFAQPAGSTQGSAQPQAQEGSSQLEEIVVTARRKSEKLQNVPQTVTAVTGQDLTKFNLLNFTDLSGFVPGLAIVNGGAGFNDTVSLRGVSFNPVSGSQDTVAFYLNNIWTTNNLLTTSNFDVGQIEVLRGPQGTLRGEPAPSGSIIVSTRRPDLYDFGGYITATGSTLGTVNAQGAVNVPVIQDMLAVRVAGLLNQDDFKGVKSIYNSEGPFEHTNAGRLSVLYDPTDDISAFVTYQHLGLRQQNYAQVEGPGAPGGVNPNAPANYNGPNINPYDRLSVQPYPNILAETSDIVTGNFNWSFAGQRLDYDAGWFRYGFRETTNVPVQVQANQAPGINADNRIQNFNYPYTTQRTITQEVRLSSDEPDRLWDYTAGVFYRRTRNQVDVVQNGGFTPGAFGAPGTTPDPFVYHPQYTIFPLVDSPKVEKELSGFAHVTLHLPDNTEATAGVRYLDYRANGNTNVTLLPGTSVAAALPPAFASICAAGVPSRGLGPGVYGKTYPGVCDFSLIPTVALNAPQNLRGNPWIYEVSLSHRFNENLLVYANSGSSWRPPGQSVGIYNGANDPTLNTLLNLKAETSYTFEGGVKSNWLNNRLRLNVAYYHQIYDSFLYTGLPVLYLQNNGATTQVTSFSFNSNPDAVIDGVDVDGGFQITPQWSLDLNAAYANGHLTGSPIPCNPPNGGTTAAAFPPGTYVFVCPSNASTSTLPKFTTTLQSEYTQPVWGDIEGYVRGRFTYYGPNSAGSFIYEAPAYGLLDLFFGLRDPGRGWDAMLFLKNALDTQRVLSKGYPDIQPISGVSPSFGPTGYSTVGPTGTGGLTPRQEFGITVTYEFGSR